MQSRGESQKALLTAIVPGEPATILDETAVDWNWVIDRARAHKVAALLAARRHNSPSLTLEQRGRLEQARADAGKVVAAAERTLGHLDTTFDAAGIPFLVVKGCVLSRCVYPTPDMRSFFDLDVVVHPRHVASAAQLLESLDYRLGQVRQTLGVRPEGGAALAAARRTTRRFYERFDHELPYVAPSESGLLPIDLHWLVAPPRRLPVDAGELWKETRRVALGGIDVTTLTAEATVVHLAIHATTCAFAGFRLLHLCDVVWAVHAASYSAARLWELAAKWRVERQLDVVFVMASRLFGVPMPSRTVTAPAGGSLPLAFSTVAEASFLLEDPSRSSFRRLRKEVLWGLAMGCLLHNVARSIGVRWARAQWWYRHTLGRVTGRW